MNRSPIHVLLIEDNPADALLLKHMLTEAGDDRFRITHVEFMVDVVRCLLQDAYDAILLDLSLPDSHGIETVAHVNAIAPHIAIVVMAGLDDEAAAIEAVRHGAQDFLIKGYSDSRLLTRAISYARERKRLDLQLIALNETLEQRVAERTATANCRAAQLQALALELTHTEQRERRRLAKMLHDDLQQTLYAARLNLGTLRGIVEDGVREKIEQVDRLLDESIARSRSLTMELSPPVLYEAGLPAALEWLGRYMEERYGLTVEVCADSLPDAIPEELRLLLFHATRELLFNVIKHAAADCARVAVFSPSEGEVQVLVSDDGVGFDPNDANDEKTLTGGFGLFSIRERLELLGGGVEIDTAPGRGTRVGMTVPCGHAWKSAAHRKAPEDLAPTHPHRELISGRR